MLLRVGSCDRFDRMGYDVGREIRKEREARLAARSETEAAQRRLRTRCGPSKALVLNYCLKQKIVVRNHCCSEEQLANAPANVLAAFKVWRDLEAQIAALDS